MIGKSRLLACAACFAFCGAAPLAAQSGSRTTPDRSGAKTIGMMSCASASCHGQTIDEALGAGTARQEFMLWLEHDPHARAAHTLNSAAFKRILTLVSSGSEDGVPSVEVYIRCAQCHDPQGLSLAEKGPAQLMATQASAGTRGMSCESCHGPAEKWLMEHYRRDVSKEELAELGMTDTDNVLVRARACAACHVGDGARDMNHDMIAAGHPPLRFELSAYHDLIRHKHWSDAERIDTPQFKVQLWAAGQLATVESTLALLQSRAERAAADADTKPSATWPEFAEFDCQACHQRLRPAKVGSSRVDLGNPGAPRWQPWNLALAPRLLKELPAWDVSRATTPGDAARQAALLRVALGKHPLAQSLASSAERTAPVITGEELLNLLENHAADDRPTWATTCQELLALKAAYLAWRDERRKLMRPADALALNSASGDSWSLAFRQDLDDLTAALRFGSNVFEWPAFDWEGLPPDGRKFQPTYESLPEIQTKMRELAGRLRSEFVRLEGDGQ